MNKLKTKGVGVVFVLAISLLVVFGFSASASALTVPDYLEVWGVSSLGGTVYNPQAPVTIGDTLDVRGPIINQSGPIRFSDDYVVEGLANYRLGQVVQGTTDYQGTIFNSTYDVAVGDNLMVDGYIWRRAGDLKFFDGAMFQGHVYPFEDLMYNLGTSSKRWKNIYAGNISATDANYDNLTTTGDVNLSGVLGIGAGTTNDVDIYGNLLVTGTVNPTDINYTGTLTGPDANFTDDVTIGDTLTVGGPTALNNTLQVASTSDLSGFIFNSSGVINVNDDLSQTGGGQVTFSGNVDALAGLDVTGGPLTVAESGSQDDLMVGSVFYVDDSGNANGNAGYVAAVQGNLDVSSIVRTNSLNVTNQIFNGSGSVTVSDSFVVENTSDLRGALSNSLGDLTINDNLVVTGTSDLQGAISNSTGNLSVNDALDVTGLSSLIGGATLGANLNMSGNDIINANNITAGGIIQGNAISDGVGAFMNAGMVSGNMLTDGFVMLNQGGIATVGGPPFINIGWNGVFPPGIPEVITIGDPAGVDAVFVDAANWDVGISGPLGWGTFTGLSDGIATLSGGVLNATTLTDGVATLTGGNLTGASGLISMWTNDVGYVTAATETDPIWTAAEPNYGNLNQAEIIVSNWNNTANPWLDNEVDDALTINGGTIDNTPIGSGTPSTGAFTTLNANSMVLAGGNLTGAGTIDAVTLQQGGTPIDNIYVNELGDTMAGNLLMAGNNVTGAGTISGTTLTDGVATLTGGNLTGVGTLTASGAIQGGSLTDGTATLAGGNLTGAGAITASGAIQGGSLTDGTATLTGGNLSGVGTITATTLTDGTATLTGGNLTGAGTVTATTLTDGTASLTGGNLTGAGNVTSTTFTVGVGGPTITSGAVPPGGVCTTGSLYLNTAGGANTTLYVCEAAAWVGK